MDKNNCLLIRGLIDISVLSDFSMSDWDLFIRQARHANMLAKIYYRLKEFELLEKVPQQALLHLQSRFYISERHSQSAFWEIDEINKVLSSITVPVILLKGAAYLALNLNAAKGRLFNDLDILVPKKVISKVEKELWKDGWLNFHNDEYDQRYYRKWMHELPPLKHENRGTVLDVHHTILPETAKLKVNVEQLFREIVPVAGYENVYTFSEPDLVRGVDMVMVGITPFQYNPVTKELIVYRDIKIEVKFSGGNGNFGEERYRSRWWDPLLSDMLLNFESQ